MRRPRILVKVKAKGLGVFFETGLGLLNIGIINHEKNEITT